jgi:hypothetical protein
MTTKTAVRRVCAAAAGVLLGLAVLQAPVLAATPTAASAPAATRAPASAAPTAGPASGSTALETKFQAAGPDQVGAMNAYDPASRGSFRLYFPANLGARRVPIVTWGNRTGATPPVYESLLKHIASYGYAVVASYTEVAVTLRRDCSSNLRGCLARHRICGQNIRRVAPGQIDQIG